MSTEDAPDVPANTVADEAVEARAILRDMIRHEDQLRNERLGWLLTLNGFLFAALGFAWGAKDSSRLVFVLALLGVIVGISALAAMQVSNKAIQRLINAIDAQTNEGAAAQAPVIGATNADFALWVRLFMPWTSLPWALVLVWPLLFILRAA